MKVDIICTHIFQGKDDDAWQFTPACRQQFSEIEIVSKKHTPFCTRFGKDFAIGQFPQALFL